MIPDRCSGGWSWSVSYHTLDWAPRWHRLLGSQHTWDRARLERRKRLSQVAEFTPIAGNGSGGGSLRSDPKQVTPHLSGRRFERWSQSPRLELISMAKPVNPRGQNGIQIKQVWRIC